jgi:hypothetical protein
MPPESKPLPPLNPDDLFAAEYSYIANTAFQAHEDRSRIASFYIVSVGSIIAAILSTQFSENKLESFAPAFSILFIFLTILGTLTVAQLARLRAAWHDSVQAMNKIKDFYIEVYPDIESAFKWRGTTIPPTDKPFSIANLAAFEVVLLSSVTCAAAIYFLLVVFGGIAWWGWLLVVVLPIVGGFFLRVWYKHLLHDKHKN